MPSPPVQLKNPSGHVVEEISVVRHGNDRTLVLMQMRLEPLDAFRIEMVGRLVEQKHIRLPEEQAAQGHPSPLASAQCAYPCVWRRTLQGVHGPFQLGIHFPAVAVLNLLGQFTLPLYQSGHLLVRHRLGELHVHLLVFLQQIHDFLHAFLHHFKHGLVVIHPRFLLQIPYRVPRSPDHLTLIGLLHSGDYLQQCGLPGSVQSYDAYLRTVEERQVYVLEYRLVVVGQHLAHPVHGKNYLLVSHNNKSSVRHSS